MQQFVCFNLLSLAISTIHFFLFMKIGIVTITSFVILFFTVILFLKWRQDEIIKSIRFKVIWRNKVKLNDNFKVYHKFTKTVNELSRLINMVIGIIYILTPFMFSQGIVILNEQANNGVDMFMKIFFMFSIPIWIIAIFIIKPPCLFYYYCQPINTKVIIPGI